MIKKCTICNKRKDIKEFPWKQKSKEIKHSQCFECHRKYQKEYYLKNKENVTKKTYEARDKRRKDIKDYIKQLKESGCKKCKEKRIPTLEFHHRDRLDKEHTIAKMITGCYSLEKIKKEIKKCDILCANCHRMEHFK